MQLFENRYVRLTLLTLAIGLLFWAIIWLVLTLVGINDFPTSIQLTLAFLGAGLLVYKFFAGRIF
ncbi:MAG TPA: hypothetical protein VF597_00535 [Candidatus Saccharimonadales bacterium]|jgi:hypothetical protein